MKLKSGLYNLNCMKAMKSMPDKCFDLAIVDPPYGGKILAGGGTKNPVKYSENGLLCPDLSTARMSKAKWFDRYRNGGLCQNTELKDWDFAPPIEYFKELQRVSKNQIIWGGNFFPLPPTRCVVVWRKTNISDKFSMAACELAWTSFNKKGSTF